MSAKTKIISIVGARPQFVKLAPIARAFTEYDFVDHKVVHTGQHYDENMSASFFDQLRLPRPDIDLAAGSGSHARQTAAIMVKSEDYFLDEQPDAVIVYGDTNSTLAAAIAASKLHIPALHVEAGLRSFNRTMPEEINRLVADHCADRLYAPTPLAMQNLVREGLGDKALLSGDVMLDAVLSMKDIALSESTILEELQLVPQSFGLVTIHRASNTTTENLEKTIRRLEECAINRLPLVFAVHPRTRAMMQQLNYSPPESLRIVHPLAYLDIIRLIESARLIITDSGGVQKEAAFLQTPCLTMRGETEWIETVEMGVNQLVGEQGGMLMESIDKFLQDDCTFDGDVQMQTTANYGNGEAAQMIVSDCIVWLQGR